VYYSLVYDTEVQIVDSNNTIYNENLDIFYSLLTSL